jgi:outer membrane protein assembly factor BamB
VLSPISSFSHQIEKVALENPHNLLYENDWYVNNKKLVKSDTNQKYAISSVKENTSSKTESFKGIMNFPWPMQSHDIIHTGRSSYSTINITGTEIWRKSEGCGSFDGSAIIDNNEVIYFGTGGPDSSLYAFHPNGTKKWRYKADGSIWATPSIAEDGTIIFPTSGGYGTVHAVNPDGTVKWTYRDNYETQSISSPAIASDGTIFFGSEDYPNFYIYALNANGTLRWKYSTGDICGAPAIGSDGTVYIGSCDNHLYAMNPNGTLRWRYDTGSDVKGAPTIAPDGTIYTPAFNSYFYALTPDGNLLWKGYTGDSVAAAGIALAEDGTIYIGTERLRAYNPDGTLKWTADTPGDVYGTVPAVSADGTIFVSAGLNLVAMNPNGTMRWSKEIASEQIRSSPSIGPGNRIYVGSNNYPDNDWFFHAFGLGPLQAEAQGPYQGTALIPTQFKGIAFGGTLPYSYLWDFGDGNTSSELAPTYTYQQGGNYTATFTLTDSTGNRSIDITNVSIDYPYHLVTITKPINKFYLFNIQLFKTNMPVIIGPITVEINISRTHYEIDHVYFHTYKEEFTDEEPPFTWTWTNPNFFRIRDHITVVVTDVKNRSVSTRIDVIKWL